MYHQFNTAALMNMGLFFETEEEAALFAAVITEELEKRVERDLAQYTGNGIRKGYDIHASHDEKERWIINNLDDYRYIFNRCKDRLCREIIHYKKESPGLTSVFPHEFREHGIEELDLTVRSFNCLKRAGINTLGELLDYGDLSDIYNLGKKGAEEIMDKLSLFR